MVIHILAGKMIAPSYVAGSKFAYWIGNMMCIAEVGSCYEGH